MQPKTLRIVAGIMTVAIALSLIGFYGYHQVAAQRGAVGAAQLGMQAKGQAGQVTLQHVVNMASVPVETASATSQRSLSPLTGVTSAQYAQRKAAAKQSHSPPRGASATPATTSPQTPYAYHIFEGMDDSAAICNCQPPDMAIGANAYWVIQGVNSAFAVYSITGQLQTGWPKSTVSFFGIPSPGACDSAFVSDPRIVYDSTDQRFFAAILQVQGAFGIDTCPEVSKYWIAVSQTNDPRGNWNVYSVDMTFGTTNVADYTQMGFDSMAIYLSGNMFSQDGSAYEYAEVLSVNKSQMENGQTTHTYGFTGLSYNGTLMDTVQPVQTESRHQGPQAEFFLSTYNINSGGGECGTGCSGLVVWAFSNPIAFASGGANPVLSAVQVGTPNYSLPPQASEPGCANCIETLDTRISATPHYRGGFLYGAIATGFTNSSNTNVAAILWFQVHPVLNHGASPCTLCTTISGATTMEQDGYFLDQANGNQSDFFPALMTDAEGNMYMIYDTMSSSLNPTISYTARRVTEQPNTFPDAGHVLITSSVPTNNSRWGDYSAMNYDGPGNDHIWMAAEYATASGDWGTHIAAMQYNIRNP